MKKLTPVIGLAIATTLALTACSNAGSKDDGTKGANNDASAPLIVGASPTPHAKVLRYINDNLAAKSGLKLQVKEYQDYIQPNEALAAGDLDANYYQTKPYLEKQMKENANYKFVGGAPVHLEPLGLYSNKIKDIKDLKDGATIGIINDPTNQERALRLLEANGLLKLPASGNINVTVAQRAENNTHNFKFKEVDGAMLVRTLDDVDVALVNGNFAQIGGKSPKDAILIESTANNPANNILVWRENNTNDPRVKKLEELLHSPEVQQYIEQNWPDQSVIPAK